MMKTKKSWPLMRKAFALILCCAMLTCNAFAASPTQVFEAGDTIITLGGTSDHGIMPLADNQYVFTDTDITNRTSTYTLPRTCYPVNGNRVFIEIENTGDTTLLVSGSVNVQGESISWNPSQKTSVAPGDCFPITISSNSGAGLDGTFSISVSPRNTGEVMNFHIRAVQYWVQ